MASRHFEGKEHAKLYQQFRLQPPPQLIERVVQYLREKYDGELNLAIDVGCGSGQSTFCYANYFKKVKGFDISSSQIAVANEQNDKLNVEFEVSPAEQLKIADNSVQLITVMEAAHWFDLPKFFDEVSRVLCHGGVLALYIYRTAAIQVIWEKDLSKTEQLRYIRQEFARKPMEEFRPPETSIVLDEYRNIVIPLDDFVRDETSFFDERKVSLADLLGRMQTSSSFQRMKEKRGDEAAQALLKDVEMRVLGLIEEDLDQNDDRSPAKIYFIQRTPFALLLARKLQTVE